MATPGKQWFHITIGTLNNWLPGDPRGWRSRHHKRHSSGDHRNPPPPGEHAALHRYAKSISGDAVVVPKALRVVIGQTMLAHLQSLEHELLVISVGGMHTHLQVQLPFESVKREIGRAKRRASIAVNDAMPGRLWGKGCGIEPIRDRAHQRNTYGYIRGHYVEGAWVWTFREGEL